MWDTEIPSGSNSLQHTKAVFASAPAAALLSWKASAGCDPEKEFCIWTLLFIRVEKEKKKKPSKSI